MNTIIHLSPPYSKFQIFKVWTRHHTQYFQLFELKIWSLDGLGRPRKASFASLFFFLFLSISLLRSRSLFALFSLSLSLPGQDATTFPLHRPPPPPWICFVFVGVECDRLVSPTIGSDGLLAVIAHIVADIEEPPSAAMVPEERVSHPPHQEVEEARWLHLPTRWQRYRFGRTAHLADSPQEEEEQVGTASSGWTAVG